MAASERHSLGASVSNGPALAAVSYENRIDDIECLEIQRQYSSFQDEQSEGKCRKNNWLKCTYKSQQ